MKYSKLVSVIGLILLVGVFMVSGVTYAAVDTLKPGDAIETGGKSKVDDEISGAATPEGADLSPWTGIDPLMGGTRDFETIVGQLVDLQIELDKGDKADPEKIAAFTKNGLFNFKPFRPNGLLRAELDAFRAAAKVGDEKKDIEQAINHVLNNLAIEIADERAESLELTEGDQFISVLPTADLVKSLVVLGWLDMDDLAGRNDTEATFKLLGSDKRVNVIGYKGDYVQNDIDSFIDNDVNNLDANTVATIITTDKAQEELLLADDRIKELLGNKIFIALIEPNSPADQQWIARLGSKDFFDFKGMSVAQMLGDRDLIESLAEAK